MEQKRYKLGEIGTIVTGKTPSTTNANFFNGDIPFITPSDISGNPFMLENAERHISEEGFKSIASNTISGVSVLVGCIGSDMGNVAIVKTKCATNQQINAITQIKSFCNPVYLYYLLSTYKSRFKSLAGSTTTPILPKSVFEDIDISLPLIEVQNSIASFLSNIDKKIVGNRQINQNLEAIAKQLYNYWFVQFDFPNEEGKPYKSSGGAMAWNEKLKHNIPVGWFGENICRIADILSGGTPSKAVSEYWNGNIPFFGPTDYKGSVFQLQTSEHITEDGLKHCASSLFESGTVIITARGSVGKLVIVGTPMAMNQSCYALHSKNNQPEYLFYLTKQLIEQLKVKGSGSVFKSIISQDIETSFLCIAPEELIKRFGEKVSPLFGKIRENSEEIISLTQQRDELLPLLMNGQVSVTQLNSDLSFLYIIRNINLENMKESIIQAIVAEMQRDLDCRQMARLKDVLIKELQDVEVTECANQQEQRVKRNAELLDSFLSAKKVEGCSEKTLSYYRHTIERMLLTVAVAVCHVSTSDIRQYLSAYQEEKGSSKVTIDNMRRIFSSFFAWLEDEDYIAKSPVRRIHKVKTDSLVKEVLSDEQLEQLRDNCTNRRDLAIVDVLASTGIRVGELVKLNRSDIDFHERQCIVFGKGNKERMVYFNARTKLHLQQYLAERADSNPALFVSLASPHNRLTISGVEVCLRKMGQRLDIPKVHPHKFRRTLATMAIDKGMPIEQVQRLLGHVRIDTTLHYAIVNQNNVKMAHKKYIG